VVDQEKSDRNLPIRYCSMKWSFSHLVENVDPSATLGQQLGDLEVTFGRC
jgi:hypothetical protein